MDATRANPTRSAQVPQGRPSQAAIAKARLGPAAARAAAQAGLSTSARFLLVLLVGESWPHDDGDGWAVSRSSQAELANLAGVKARQLRRMIREIEAAGLVHTTTGAGRDRSLYVLTTTNPHALAAPLYKAAAEDRPPKPARSSVTGQGGHRRPGRAVTDDRTSVSDPICAQKEFSIISGESGDPRNRAESQPRRLPGATPDPRGSAVRARRELQGRAALAFERLATRPAWASGRWIDPAVAEELARLEATTLEVVDAALAEAKAARSELSNAAGFVVARVRTPDPEAVAELRETRRRQAEADEAAERRRLEAQAAEAAAHAIDAEARADQDRLRLELGDDAVDELVELWLNTRAAPGERALLLHRTPAERRASILRRCALRRILEELRP